MNNDRPCPIASQVADAVIERSRRGMAKYGVNAARTDLSREQWLQHLQEELLDAAVYAERLKSEVSEIESLKRQNAALRAALEMVIDTTFKDATGQHPTHAWISRETHEKIRAALQTDAGHDFIPREQVKPLVDALKVLDVKGVEIGIRDKSGTPSYLVAGALARAKTLGF